MTPCNQVKTPRGRKTAKPGGRNDASTHARITILRHVPVNCAYVAVKMRFFLVFLIAFVLASLVKNRLTEGFGSKLKH